MKLKTEIANQFEEEIIIRCKERTDKIKRIERVIENLIREDGEIVLKDINGEYFIPYKKILFFEMQNGKIVAHTKDRFFNADGTLQNLENLLPHFFIRASKSCIINGLAVAGLAHNITGPSKVYFTGSDKIIFASRSYYKFLKEKIYRLRGL